MKNNEIDLMTGTELGGDTVAAYTYGRLDAALGEEPSRFSDPQCFRGSVSAEYAMAIRQQYIFGFREMQKRINAPAKIQPAFANEFPNQFA